MPNVYKRVYKNTDFSFQDLEQAEQNKILTISRSRKPPDRREQLHYLPIRCIDNPPAQAISLQVDSIYEVFNLLTAFSC
ncbi:hypothetical protein [Nostoc sp. DSM 114161]|uniref:hypothetical protein n=1 Tax=Nostoc sp. DSM 114161 TaxID=3440143 RepID=UPI00404580CC